MTEIVVKAHGKKHERLIDITRKTVYINMKLHQYEEAYNNALELLDLQQQALHRNAHNNKKELQETRVLLRNLERQSDILGMYDDLVIRMVKSGFDCFHSIEDKIDFTDFEIDKPKTKFHIIGHKIRLV